MNNDYIRKAVELADYLDINEDHDVGSVHYASGTDRSEIPQFFLDALAAQLVRQVDAVGLNLEYKEARSISNAMLSPKNRTMNTIIAIVDSGVLDEH